MKKEEFFREGRDCAEVSAVPPEGVVKLGVSILITAGCFKKV